MENGQRLRLDPIRKRAGGDDLANLRVIAPMLVFVTVRMFVLMPMFVVYVMVMVLILMLVFIACVMVMIVLQMHIELDPLYIRSLSRGAVEMIALKLQLA